MVMDIYTGRGGLFLSLLYTGIPKKVQAWNLILEFKLVISYNNIVVFGS